MGYEGTEDRTACPRHVRQRDAGKEEGHTCTTYVCAVRARTNNGEIAKRALHPPVLRGREHSARSLNPAQSFRLANLSYSTFNDQAK
jgi:hypothetical protein